MGDEGSRLSKAKGLSIPFSGAGRRHDSLHLRCRYVRAR
jgi:hypothetical protein